MSIVRPGPVTTSGGVDLYDCPCGCGMLVSTPAQRCRQCNTLQPATHWDGLIDVCGECAKTAYGD